MDAIEFVFSWQLVFIVFVLVVLPLALTAGYWHWQGRRGVRR